MDQTYVSIQVVIEEVEFSRNNMLCGDASIDDKLSWVQWNENDFDSDDPNQFDQGFHTNNNVVKTFQVNNYEVFQLLS